MNMIKRCISLIVFSAIAISLFSGAAFAEEPVHLVFWHGMSGTNGEIIDYLTERILSQRIDYEHSNSANVWIEDAGNISAFLEGVMVHPSAPEWYVNIVQDICLQKGIRFDGQSQIYKLK